MAAKKAATKKKSAKKSAVRKSAPRKSKKTGPAKSNKKAPGASLVAERLGDAIQLDITEPVENLVSAAAVPAEPKCRYMIQAIHGSPNVNLLEWNSARQIWVRIGVMPREEAARFILSNC